MKKFKFSLEAVEKVRIQKEQDALSELARVQAVYQQKINEKSALVEKKRLGMELSRLVSGKQTTIEAYRIQELHLQGLNLQILRSDQAIVRTRRFLDQALRNVIKSRRELRMIEKLKEKAIEEYKQERSKKDQKDLDDLISMRAHLSEFLTGEESVES